MLIDLKGQAAIIKVWPFFIALIFTSFIPSKSFSSSSYYIEKSRQLKLSSSDTWRGLLHFSGSKSQIVDESFFLSKEGKYDAQAELEATLEAYFDQPSGTNPDSRLECRYPARLSWLNEQLGLPSLQIDSTVCPRLISWSRLNEVEDISLIFVSGYLGNPASTFGHVLLNLKTAETNAFERLLNTSVSYGATVPINENIFNYISKGLLGGYFGTFSDKSFFAHDQVYSCREGRDMWEYVINLTERQRNLLIFHIAELLTKKYKYYFLSANCAQRIASLIDIFIKEEIYKFYHPVYVPEKLFHRLSDINNERLENGDEEVIEKVSYIPSARRILYREIEKLSPEEKYAFREISSDKNNSFAPMYQLPAAARIKILNALLSYQYYKLMSSNDKNADRQLEEYKGKILLERLRLPPAQVPEPDIPELPSPHEIAPPNAFIAGVVFERDRDIFSILGLTVFKRESVGLNAFEFNELVALDVNIGIQEENNIVFVDKFDFLKIIDFKTLYIDEAGESPVSWQVRAGMDRYENNNNAIYDFTLEGGIGLVDKLQELGIIYGFLNASAHSAEEPVRLIPSVGLAAGNKQLKAKIDYGLEFETEHFDKSSIVKGKLQFQISRNKGVQLSYEKNHRERITVSYQLFW